MLHIDWRSPFMRQIDLDNPGINRKSSAVDPLEFDGILVRDTWELAFEEICSFSFSHVEVWG